MNTTVTNILKLLSQSKMNIDDILHYVKVEKSAIQKSINQLNEFLEILNLDTVKKEKEEYVLRLKKQELEFLYLKMNFLTTEEKIDYLYLKFICKGFLNLEREKDILNISRSTILRCFKSVKETLDRNGSNYDYAYGKGLKLNLIGEEEKGYFCKKLMKYFIENSYLSSPLKELLEEIREIEIDDRVNKINIILEKLNIVSTYPFIAFLISLESCVKIFNGFEKYYEVDKEDEKYQNILHIISTVGENFSSEYTIQMAKYLRGYIFKESLEGNLKIKTKIIIRKLKKALNITNLEKDLEEVLFFKIYIALFKYENKILKINRVDLNTNKRKVLAILDAILKEIGTEIYYYDKYLIINIIRDIIVTNKILEIKKVLIIFNELALVEKSFFQNGLKKILPHIEFEFQTSLIYKNKVKFYEENYDYILSDEVYNENIIKIDLFDKLLINEILEKKTFEKALKNLKKY